MMCESLCTVEGFFGAIAIVLSFVYGYRATLVDPIPTRRNSNHPKCEAGLNFFYIFIFHFIGSLIGWALLYILWTIVHPNTNKLSELATLANGLLLLFSFLGVTGHIPQSSYGFVKAFGEITKKITSKL